MARSVVQQLHIYTCEEKTSREVRHGSHFLLPFLFRRHFVIGLQVCVLGGEVVPKALWNLRWEQSRVRHMAP